MQVALSKFDIEEIDDLLRTNQVASYIKNQSRLKFSIGDILIRKIHSYDWKTDRDSWETETISRRNTLAKRYVYVHEDSTGIGFIKPLKLNGKLSDELICLADINFDLEMYEVDPIYIDSVLMGNGSFDIKNLNIEEKARRDEIAAFNKSSSLSSEKISEINSFLLNNFSNGSKLYYHDVRSKKTNNDFLSSFETYTVKSITEKYLSRMYSIDKRYTFSHLLGDKSVCDSKKYVEIICIDVAGDECRLCSLNFVNSAIYTNKPRSLFGEE